MFFCEALPLFVLSDGDTSLFDVRHFFDSQIRHLGVVIFQAVFKEPAMYACGHITQSVYCFLIHFSVAFFMMFLISGFAFLYLSLPSVSHCGKHCAQILETLNSFNVYVVYNNIRIFFSACTRLFKPSGLVGCHLHTSIQ